MATRTWEPIHFCYCDHIKQQVALEANIVYPAELLPELEPRIVGHRCSNGMDCNLDGRPSCIWAGTNPTIDPFTTL